MAEKPSRPRPAPRRRELTVDDYFTGARAADVAILARALTLVESNHPRHQLMAEELLTRLMPFTGHAIRIGITGPPGVGKSTFINAVGLLLVERGGRVAVLAVDPSSGVSGGSILGDKTRMPGLAAQRAAYIRPSPSAGTLGGVARKSREGMLVCEAAGFDVVLIETVGAGQSETMVAGMTDCFLALMLPGAGDELQGIKRGLLDLVDVVAVNKADGDMKSAAELAAAQYRAAFQSLAGRSEDDAPAVLTCSALYRQGIDAVWDAVASRHKRLVESGRLDERRRRQNLRWLWEMVEDRLRHSLHTHPAVQDVRGELEQQVLAGVLPPEAAARKILEAFGQCGRETPSERNP